MAFLVWFFALYLLVIGTWLTWMRFRSHPKEHKEYPPVSILKPLKGADSGLRENLLSFFFLDYPNYEIIFSVASESDPAYAIVGDLIKKYPGLARLVVGEVEIGLNPKVNNLVRSYELAKNDLILISDSNVKVKPGYLKHVTSHLAEDVGVITAVVAGVEPKGIGGWLEAVYLNTFYARGMNLAFSAGKPCVVGKSMMFRKSNAAKFGGIRSSAMYLAEDFYIGEEMRKLGLRIVLMRDPIDQYIGNYSFRAFWDRHIRWGRIRKSQAILPFLLEPFATPISASLMAGIIFTKISSISFLTIFILQLLVCMAADIFIAAKMVNKISWKIVAAWLLREFLSIPMWVVVASGDKVVWRGKILKLKLGGRIEEKTIPCQDYFSGELPLVLTKWKDAINTSDSGFGRELIISRVM